jgi:hypothetical protein
MVACVIGGGDVETEMSSPQWDVEFNDGYGSAQGSGFTAWGEKNVYFPVLHDGAEWVGCVPRNPCRHPTDHQGGE